MADFLPKPQIPIPRAIVLSVEYPSKANFTPNSNCNPRCSLIGNIKPAENGNRSLEIYFENSKPGDINRYG